MSKPISSPTKTHKNINKFNYLSRPTSTLSTLLESDFHIKSFEISQHGRTGVFFIETNNGSFVMKSSNDGPKDEFLNRLAAMLSLSVPQTICFCCSQPIFHKIMFEIQKYCEKDECLYARIKIKLDFPFYQVLEYVPSISIAQIGKERFEAHLLDENKLYTLGMCLGFDLIINNSDRLNLLWRGDGNINNVLVQINDHDSYQLNSIKNRSNIEVPLGNYVFIDHSGYLLDLKNPLAAKNFETYMVKAADFLVRLIRSLSEEKPLPEEFQKLTKQFLFYSHYGFSDFDLRTISHGIIYIIKKFLELFESNSIQSLYDNLKKPSIEHPKAAEEESRYWFNYWNTELLKVNIDFLQKVYDKIAAIFATYPETIEKIIEKVGDIDQHVGNANFNDLNDILDVTGSNASKKKTVNYDPEGNNDLPSNILIPTKEEISPERQGKSQENTIKQPMQKSTVKQNADPYQDPIKEEQSQQQSKRQPEGINDYYEQQPQVRHKNRKWREKLEKFKNLKSKSP